MRASRRGFGLFRRGAGGALGFPLLEQLRHAPLDEDEEVVISWMRCDASESGSSIAATAFGASASRWSYVGFLPIVAVYQECSGSS